MFSPPRTYNGGVEGGGSHFQVLLRYSRWLPCHYLGMPPEAAEACLCLSLLRHNHLTGHIPHWRLASNDDACITNLHGDHGLPNGQGHRGLWLNI